MTDSGSSASEKIAIIGIGCRLPGGASDPRTYWQNLINGRDCVTATPADRYDIATLGSRDKGKPGHLTGGRGGYIDGFDEFDPAFFGISPREAHHMDPQQRKLLEVAWEALEDGAQKPAELAGGDVGVFIGAFTLDYKILQFADLGFETLAAHTATGTMMTMVSNRISHSLDFRGPSVSLDTACSSSLVAVHLARQSLLRGETDLALAGGTLLHMAPQYTIAETQGGFLSPDGQSRTFDAAANGYVRAEGVGVIALKRLSDALRDGDPVHAVVTGSGVNQDGRTTGITVPNADAQVALIERVCAEAGVRPGSLQYVEAHGTSTPVGDPIEANALGRALSIGRDADTPCYVGSVKANIGHTEAAAGVAGLIKTALSLKHRMIPPHINLEKINPAIDPESLPYTIPTRATAWPPHQGPARAGVNSFGFGGTNAHVLLEEAPPVSVSRDQPQGPAGYTILPLTTRDPAVLPELVRGVRRELVTAKDSPSALTDLGHTLAHRRQHLESRLSVVYASPEELDEGLSAFLRGEAHPGVLSDQYREAEDRRLVWVFTGMGPQWWAMGRQLYESEPVYREAVQRCDRELRVLTGWSLIEELLADEAESKMSQTWLAQPANFAVQVGLAALWRSHGVTPDAVVGHSTGEVAAFYEAGVYSLADAARVVFHRSRLQQRLVGTGTMLAVSLPENEALRRVAPYGDRVSVAAVNSPTAITLAGDEDALTELSQELRDAQIFARFVGVHVPYHSARMEPIKEELLSSLAGLAPRPATVPLYLTGREGRAHGTELDAAYWWHNVRDSVRFRAAIDQLVDDGHQLFLEIGPHPVLGHSIKECLTDRGAEGKVLPSIRRQEDEAARVTMSLAALHNLGVGIDWDVLHPAGKPVPLPCYPWKRDRYWVEPAPVARVRLGQVDHPLLGRRLISAQPVWETRLDTEKAPYLGDHQIQGNVVFPAAAYCEMAIQAVRALTEGTEATLAEIELRKALFLPENEARTVQLSFSSEEGSFSVASVPGAGAEPSVHMSGAVRSGQRRRLNERLDGPAIRARSELRLNGPDCYAKLAALGYEYGPAFQGIEEVWVSQDEALARVRPPEVLAGDAARHHVHPVLLDACFQSLLTPLLAEQGREPGASGMRLPLSIAEVSLAPVGDQPLWVHATLTRQTGDELVGDISVYADSGAPLGRISGFRAADVEKTSMAVGQHTIDGWLADVAWSEVPAVGGDGALSPAHDWLVFADRQGVADELAALVAAQGGRCHLVRPGPAYQRDPARRATEVTPGSAADLDRLFADATTAGVTSFGTVVHLWNLDLPGIDATARNDLTEHSSLGGYSLIALAQALTSLGFDGRLHIATRGTQAVAEGDPVEPLGAPAWGIGRVLRHQELVTAPGKLIDLDPVERDAGVRADAEALLREALVADEDEIALRASQRYASRLRQAAGLTRPLPLRLRGDGSYLVTGAFGALGRLLCRTLVKRGARRLILASRSRLPERAVWAGLDPDSGPGRMARFVRELEELGAQPVLAPLDVTSEPELTAWLASYREQEGPPIRGVFHLAGQVRDTPVREMDRAGYDTVLDPKMAGAYLLHRWLRDEPLEHFVLFASIASLLTTTGQTNYAAGNAFLDALAHHRRARGLPALSLDWGPWATGMIEELGLIDHYRNNRGMSSLSPEAGMAVLERVIGQDRAQLLVATVVDWPVFLSWYDSPPPLVRELAVAAQGASSPEHHSFLDAYREAGEEKRQLLLAERFTSLVAAVLRVATERIDPAASLNALGLDSLLAMELRGRINGELGVGLPVVALLSSTPISELIAQLRESLLELLAQEASGGAGGTAIETFTDERQYPLTQNQKALWFLKQLNPDGFAYNIGGAVTVRVALDPELMFEAFRELLARHPLLRANFLLEDGRPVQRISDEIAVDTALFDVRGMPWNDIHDMIVQEYRKPYDLERDALVRFRLFQRGEDHWVIMKAVHHIVSDAMSTFTFIEELFSVYEELREGRPAALPPVPSRYLDFLNWQNQFLAGPDAQRMLAYWRDHLPTEVPTLDLPTDKPRPAVQTDNGASEFFVLDAALSARVHALAREHNVTVFMVLLSAYYLLLHRYSGQDDIIVGSPVSGRTEEEFASVYGYFVNPLPLRVNLSSSPTTAELLEQVRATVLGGLDNQEYPFVMLVDELGLQHDPSRSAVFQAMFILLTHKVATEQYGYRLEYIELPEEEGQFDLTMSVYEDEAEREFHCVFKYNTDLFLPATVRRLTSHYVNLIDALTRASATEPVTRLDMLETAERERALSVGGDTSAWPDSDVPVHELISRAGAQRPDAVAVSAPGEHGTRRLTYGELEQRSRALAHRLRDLGVRDGTVVALALDKSPELVVALLAVLKAGGAYVPLDPGYPADRLAYMVRQSGATVLLVDPANLAPSAGLCDLVTTLDELAAQAGPSDATADPAGTTPMESPAYVIYTSGSTGQPKGVRVSHRNLASAYHAWHQEYRLDTEVRVHLQMASPSFDVFTGDLVRALCSGGSLVLVGRELLFDTASLYRTMLAERVDCAEFVPAVARALMAHCERAGTRLDFLRLLIVGSDAWKVEEYERLRGLCGPGTRVLNSYGLTEATIDSAYFEGATDTLEPGRMVPIGRPLPNSALHVLDEHGEPVPPGVPGELWIGGAGVALGYAGDPEQTTERFVTRVLSRAPGAEPSRLYRTGDLARRDVQGGIHLLGRGDSQIKVRGHRVETGEIESRLTAWPQVAEAVVAGHPDAQGDTVLHAYCVPAAGASIDGRELRRQLAGYLPTFMIPASVVELPELPLTPHGKVDVLALPVPHLDGSETEYEAPVTLYETRMAQWWSSLLGLERAGLRHDFFDSGGSSIKLIELIHHLQAEFGVTVPVSRLFKVTTLHGMARTVEDIVTGRATGSRPYLRFNEGRGQRIFGFPPAGGHGLVYRTFATHLSDYDMVAFNYLPGSDKVQRYADLVTEVETDGPCVLFGYSLGGNLAFEVAKELERRGRTVPHVVIMDSYRILEAYELGGEHIAAFERELAEHLRKHTGSEIVAAETMDQATEYLRFCGRTPNLGTVNAHVSVVSDEAKLSGYAAGEQGSWHGSSTGQAAAFQGFGPHADMLDQAYAEANAHLFRDILTGGAAHGS